MRNKDINDKFLGSFACAFSADRYATSNVITKAVKGLDQNIDIKQMRLMLSGASGALIYAIESTFDWRTHQYEVSEPVMTQFRDALFNLMTLVARYKTRQRMAALRLSNQNVNKHPMDMSRLELQLIEFRKLRTIMRRECRAIQDKAIEAGPYTAWIASREREGLSADVSEEEREAYVS